MRYKLEELSFHDASFTQARREGNRLIMSMEGVARSGSIVLSSYELIFDHVSKLSADGVESETIIPRGDDAEVISIGTCPGAINLFVRWFFYGNNVDHHADYYIWCEDCYAVKHP